MPGTDLCRSMFFNDVGFSLIALQVLVMVLRTPRRLAAVTGMLALLIAFTAPLAWHSPVLQIPSRWR